MSVLDQITAFLTGKGLTAAQAAGVAGNLQIESGFNPAAYNAREGAIGLAQWEGPRRPALQRFAASRGKPETDLGVQLDFLWSELTGSERTALAALQQTTTAAEAAAVFDQKFERSAGTSRQQRISAANAIFSGTPAFAGGSASGSGAVTESEGFLDRLNPFDDWAGKALSIGIKILLTGAAAALVVVGAMHTVKD